MREVLVERIRTWVDDPESSVVYAEEVERRWAVRMRQEVREATTVWFDVGERSLKAEAYVIPEPAMPAPVHELALKRNLSAWRVFFAVDGEGALVLRGRLSRDEVTMRNLDLMLGEIYETIEISFRPMIGLAFPARENSG